MPTSCSSQATFGVLFAVVVVNSPVSNTFEVGDGMTDDRTILCTNMRMQSAAQDRDAFGEIYPGAV
jgi:hypothetical protein